jgi:thiosulfate/3-mercaptopyruvate sulfurtransferase
MEDSANKLEPADGSPPLVDSAWIVAHGDHSHVRLVELDVSPVAYEAGHIPNAVLWNAYSDLRDSDYQPVARPKMEALLSRSGVSPETTLVFYGYGAALGFWLMKAYGHRDVRMLLGSREQWAECGGEWSTLVPEPAATSYALCDPDPGVLSVRADVEAAGGVSDLVLLDVRSELEYRGERFWPSGATADAGRAGCIPGAISVPIDLLRADDDTFRSADEMVSALERAGAGPEQTVIIYCTIGNRASQAWFAMKYILGYPNVSVYYGSWVEWGRAPDSVVER